MLAQVMSGAVLGIDAFLVRVEVHLARALPSMTVVGLAESAVREGRERVMAALTNSGFEIPPRKVTVNLSPADVHKSGSAFDVPMALGLLAADGKLPAGALDDICAIGELGLDGEVRAVRGALPIADRCRLEGVKKLLVPEANAAEAASVQGVTVYAVKTLQSVVNHLQRIEELPVACSQSVNRTGGLCARELDYADVRAQHFAKRALEIAAAGGHNVLLVGPPGAGKSMLARRLPGILPLMTMEEAIEVTKVYSVAGRLAAHESLVECRPFRAPHHTASDAAMIGGGAQLRPGEVTLAHRGVLFLDELPEFRRNVLESLRQPVEDGVVTVSRARAVFTYPAKFMMVAAMNPCPCGYHGTGSVPCVCTAVQVERYAGRISGPLLDRIDLHVRVPPLAVGELSSGANAEPSAEIRERVHDARDRQLMRYRDTPGLLSNAELTVRHVRRFCAIDAQTEETLRRAARTMRLSARAYHRILRLGRTIADLEGSAAIGNRHVSEAIQYRSLDRDAGCGALAHV